MVSKHPMWQLHTFFIQVKVDIFSVCIITNVICKSWSSCVPLKFAWRGCRRLLTFVLHCYQSCRNGGLWWAKPLEITNIINLEFLSNLRCKAPLHNRTAPILKIFWRWFWLLYFTGADPGRIGAIAPLKSTKVTFLPQFCTIWKTTFAI